MVCLGDMSGDLSAGQLISLAPPGREVVDIAHNLCQLRPTSGVKIERFSLDFLQKRNTRINHKQSASWFVVSALNRLEVDGPEDGTRYYLNAITGEVFSVALAAASGLAVDKVDDNYSSAEPSPLFTKLKQHVLSTDGVKHFQVFETEDPTQAVVVHGVSEWMESNFWSVHGSCVWTVRADNGGYLVSGSTSVNAHYYENCNFHIRFGPGSVREKRVHSVSEVFKRIESKTFKLKLKINNRLVVMDAEFDNHEAGSANSSGRFSSVHGIQPVSALKKLRRQLPVHKSKFDWNIARALLVQSI